MNRTLIHQYTHSRVGDILQSPTAFRRIYEEEKAAGNDVTLFPGLVLMKLADGEVHYIWQSGSIVVQVYQYTVQEGAMPHAV